MTTASPAELGPAQPFYRRYDLREARKQPPTKTPAAHQTDALGKLHDWYHGPTPGEDKGGLLVLPTGGGKTYTAVHFLCRGPLSDGYKVLWLAHTHHLLEQVFHSFGPTDEQVADGYEVANVSEPKDVLGIRVVSGTPGHCAVHKILPTDDVVIGTVQTIVRANTQSQLHFVAFLESVSHGKLFVVVDEAHHTPAPSYRRLVQSLRARFPAMCLLGLTATPTYSDERRRGWLKALFPQGIQAEVKVADLMASGVLAQPHFEKSRTSFEPDFDPHAYESWLGTYGDLPEQVIEHLARSNERNQAIASHYVANQERYGKTLIFADRWYQCDALREALKTRDVRADVVYSHVDAPLSTADERNRRDKDENARVLDRFRRNELDVLINVRMLTEGTDVPKLQTVFLTRQTTSSILMTQMIGRVLRGPKFGGTDKAYIVAFIDDWKLAISWADFNDLEGGTEDEQATIGARPPLQLISIDLVRQLARQMDSGLNVSPGPFVTLLPVGWYRIDFQALVQGTDDIETIQQLVMVFDGQLESYERFIAYLQGIDLSPFALEDLPADTYRDTILDWEASFFDQADTPIGDLGRSLFHVARHMAQSDGLPPRFFAFAERDLHDLDAVAQSAIDRDLGPMAANEALRHEFDRPDRYWHAIYGRYELFKCQYDACINRLLHLSDQTPNGAKPYTETTGTPREPSEATKAQVKQRDNFTCLCCGETKRRKLQIDHINPYYLGGNSDDLANLQTLCGTCNRNKGTNAWNYRIQRSSHSTLQPLAIHAMPDNPHDNDEWKCFVRRAINGAYGCAAVADVRILQRGPRSRNWEVSLFDGNDAAAFDALRPTLLGQIQSIRKRAGLDGPDSLTVLAFGST